MALAYVRETITKRKQQKIQARIFKQNKKRIQPDFSLQDLNPDPVLFGVLPITGIRESRLINLKLCTLQYLFLASQRSDKILFFLELAS